MTPPRDPHPSWRVVDADTGALVALVGSREEAARMVKDGPDGAIYLVEPPAAEGDGDA